MGSRTEHAIGQTDGESSLSPRVELHFIFEYSDYLAVLSILLEAQLMMSTVCRRSLPLSYQRSLCARCPCSRTPGHWPTVTAGLRSQQPRLGTARPSHGDP